MSEGWSGRPGSNRRHRAWEARVLPLNYSRSQGLSLILPRATVRVTEAWGLRPETRHDPLITPSTSSRLVIISSGVLASRFSRSSGSVFEPRTLKCQSG
jgi:hypothetical protein